MKIKSLRSLGIITVLMLSLVLTGAFIQANAKEHTDPRYGGDMVVLSSTEDRTMSPSMDPVGGWWFGLLNDPPFMVPPRSEELSNWNRPGWLRKFSISPDEKTLTFYIREGVTFHDGAELDAEALAWNLRHRIKSDELWDAPLRGIKDPDEDIKVLDEYTLQVAQEENNPNMRYVMSTFSWLGGLDTPNWNEKYGEDYGHEEVYSLGPFKLKEWVKGDHTTFVRNEDYDWAPSFCSNPGPAYLEEVTINYVPEAATRLSKLKTGEADMDLNVPPAYAETIKELEDYEVLTSPLARQYLLSYNTTKKPLDNVKVRKALNYAVDRVALANEIFKGYAEPANNLYLSRAHEQPTTKNMYQYDPEKARDLLSQAGWEPGDDGFRYKNGERLEIEFTTMGTSSLLRKQAIVVQANWREIGVKANIQTLDETTFKDFVEDGKHEATIRLQLWPTLDIYYWMFEGVGYPAQAMYDEPDLNELIKKNKEATDLEEWVNTTDDLVNFVLEKALRGPLVRPLQIVAVNKNFENLHLRNGSTHESAGPNLVDVYRKDVYEENTEK